VLRLERRRRRSRLRRVGLTAELPPAVLRLTAVWGLTRLALPVPGLTAVLRLLLPVLALPVLALAVLLLAVLALAELRIP
jgi:hypothetical protein